VQAEGRRQRIRPAGTQLYAGQVESAHLFAIDILPAEANRAIPKLLSVLTQSLRGPGQEKVVNVSESFWLDSGPMVHLFNREAVYWDFRQ
jgi:hypothetical protein